VVKCKTRKEQWWGKERSLVNIGRSGELAIHLVDDIEVVVGMNEQ
jgi:hypothetical protein